MHPTRRTAALAACVLLAAAAAATAELEMSSIFADHMVLQRDANVAVWGWDEPGTKVTVTFRGRAATAEAGEDGRWDANIPSGAAGAGPFELAVKGTSKAAFPDVAVGEVWLAGGQSNMWWAVRRCDNFEAVRAAADRPTIRVWDCNTHPREGGWRADEPQRTVRAEWRRSTPETVGEFPGTAYFFAVELGEALGVPVGIVHNAVPGSAIEPWLSREFIQKHLPRLLELWRRREALYEEDLAAYQPVLAAWQAKAAEARKAGRKPPRRPRGPRDPNTAARPGRFHNAMVLPAAPYTVRGFLWYQGESNAGRAEQYEMLQAGLIDEWRWLWGKPDLPFLFVELANFGFLQTRPSEEAPWPALRDSQAAVARTVPGAHRVSTIDCMTEEEGPWQIHPANKQLVGHRLFLAAMAKAYGKDIAWSGPVLKDATFAGGKAVLTFDHVADGLAARGGGKLKGFALAGADRVWHWAEAAIDGPRVVLTSGEVPRPVAARYGWANNPIGNLVNSEDLPAFPCRTDHWTLQLGRTFDD